MHRITPLAAVLALAFAAAPALAADAPAKPVKTVAKATAAKPAAKPAAPAPVAEAPLADTQLEIAQRVNTGHADCEMNQAVDVHPVDGKPGYFKVAHGKSTYTMVPQETTTGAVRLEDRKTGHVWIQIPAKSMLMDSKAGRRVVDACTHPVQRTATAEAAPATGIGIVAAPAR